MTLLSSITLAPERRSRPGAALLAATLLDPLKPLLKRALYPVVEKLARVGVTANQVTITSLAGSVAVGSWLSVHTDGKAIWGLLPAWTLARMAFATIDGTLAIDFGQKSRLGGILNEVGDVVSDIAMFLPLVWLPPFSGAWIAAVVLLTAVTEIAGIVGHAFGGSRRLEGPFGKVDRALAVGAIGVWLACLGPLPDSASILLPLFAILLLLTIGNRLRFAAASAVFHGES
ncbi:CDP-alcohol phosphatidyltransferase family protein [Tardiphaga sp.]|uniref:CDP-alcohol phosphatidyltransferase family protein n=1 Tax=Tardiphaga sp. TaxID=1926292 RepID=UPI00260DD101|nr:CDP-alcohol phosphatidyltransferase family protein [Tardiphaga sp.]MDB5620397.1 CDP-alcohol phosphatidyltransferase [Tardiphaga sp.]